jgi:hypothetical protein
MQTIGNTLGVTLFAAMLLVSANAREQQVEFGSGIFCDTPTQVERFVANFHGDALAAINTVNAEVKNPTACVAGTIAFIRGPEVATARTWNEAFHIVQIFVVGVLTETGMKTIAPAATYSIERVEERGA